jgi:hypothetical protein
MASRGDNLLNLISNSCLTTFYCFLFLDKIVSELNLPAFPSSAIQLTSATVESDVKRVIEMAFKLQKHAKRNKLTGSYSLPLSTMSCLMSVFHVQLRILIWLCQSYTKSQSMASQPQERSRRELKESPSTKKM